MSSHDSHHLNPEFPELGGETGASSQYGIEILLIFFFFVHKRGKIFLSRIYNGARVFLKIYKGKRRTKKKMLRITAIIIYPQNIIRAVVTCLPNCATGLWFIKAFRYFSYFVHNSIIIYTSLMEFGGKKPVRVSLSSADFRY